MKKGILALVDLEENIEGLLDFTFEMAKHLELQLTLLNCYPKADYNQKFDFENQSYPQGIVGLLRQASSQYSSAAEYASVKIHYLAAPGSEVDYLAKNSSQYDLILMRTQIYSNSVNKFLSSNIPYLTNASKCPIIIVPPAATFKSFENCWLIERKETDKEIVTRSSRILNLKPSTIKVKRFNQNKYSSNLWKLLNSKLDFKSYQTKNTIAKELENERVDLILLASYTQEGFKAFMNVNLARVIFQLGIPIMISHKN